MDGDNHLGASHLPFCCCEMVLLSYRGPDWNQKSSAKGVSGGMLFYLLPNAS